MSKPEPRDGLHLNHMVDNYNFIKGGKWDSWADSQEAEKGRWCGSQGIEPGKNNSGWYDKAELKVPVEYLT